MIEAATLTWLPATINTVCGHVLRINPSASGTRSNDRHGHSTPSSCMALYAVLFAKDSENVDASMCYTITAVHESLRSVGKSHHSRSVHEITNTAT